jgi:hypothetical protein
MSKRDRISAIAALLASTSSYEAQHADETRVLVAAYRKCMAELLAAISIQAGVGYDFADLGDDEGLKFSLDRLIYYLRIICRNFKELQDLQRTRASGDPHSNPRESRETRYEGPSRS